MDKRFIIAIALVFLVLLFFQVGQRMFGTKERDQVTRPPTVSDYPLLSESEFMDIASLAGKLQYPEDQLSQYLRTQFSQETLELLDSYDVSVPSSEQLQEALKLQKALADELNDLIKARDPIYDERRFAQVDLTAEVRELIAEEPDGKELVRLNRMLLEDAYISEITKGPRPKKEIRTASSELATSSQEGTSQVEEEIEGEVIPIQTPLYDLQLTTKGARAISWKLKEYFRRDIDSDDTPENIDLIPATSQKCLELDFHDPEIQDELEYALWNSDKKSIESLAGGQDSIQFGYTTSEGIDISKKMIFSPDSYVVDVDIAFRNGSLEDISVGGYSLYWGEGIAKDELIADMELAREGPMALVTTEKGSELTRHWHKTGFACFGGKHIRIPEVEGAISWVAFASKYFVAALIPGNETWWSDTGTSGKRYSVTTDLDGTTPPLPPKDVWRQWGNSTSVALVQPSFSMYPGETVLHTYRVYVGPKKWDILRNIKGRDGATESLGLGKMINFGMFSPLGKATLWLLMMFYKFIGNYGVGIIFLTLLIKILYFPLTQKSFKSMNKMKKLQPKINELKEKHRDDPQRLQKETMKLYKQNKVNPMGGCLPLLFQLPVFWALFATLRGAVELRGAMFIPGWVTDLSLSDTVARVAGFPINILPLLMTATMLLQQLFQGNPGQGQNNKMMAFMPLIFAFIFYGMPSGLVLYWLCNNILAIGHQYLIKRQEDAEIEEQPEEKGKKNRSSNKQD